MCEICINRVITDLEIGSRFIVLWIARGNEYGYWYELEGHSHIPHRFNISEIVNKAEYSRYEFSDYENPNISIPEQHISETERNHRDRIWNIIKDAVEYEPEIYEKKSRAAILQIITEESGIKTPNIYKLLDKYWSCGKTKNAFLPRFSKRGGKGTTRSQEKGKIGRKSKIGGSKAITEADRNNFEQAICKYYNKREKRSLVSVYEKLLEKFYTEKDSDGGINLLKQSERPSLRQFKYWHYRNRDLAEEKKKREGEKEFELNHRAVLGKSDYGLMGPGAQFQIDATIGDVYLVSQFNRSNIVGRPIIYFIMDAFSRMVTGMSVGLEGPSWAALSSAIINMAMDKVAFCKQYDIEITEEEWPCHHIPASLLGDRGELESKNANSLVNIFGIRVINAPPYRADLKGIIEQHFRTINANGIKQLPGSVHPEMSKRGGHDYRLDAALDIRQLTQIIIKCVLHYNNYHYMASFEKNEAMMANDVEAIPIKLWEWGTRNYSGALRPFPEDIVKFAVLPTDKATITAKGIRFKGLFYSCERAGAENWFEKARSSKTWSVKISYNPRDMENIYIWDKDLKKYETCYLLDWNSKNAGKTLTEIIYEQQKERSTGQRLKVAETESKINLNADIENIVAEAGKMNKLLPIKSKKEKISNISKNRSAERETMQNEIKEAPIPEITSQKREEAEITEDLRIIKDKLEERLKNGGTKNNL